MASLRDIRKRIRSIRSSQKITKAMKLVAASKLKRAQEAIVLARPYADGIGALMARTAARPPAPGEDAAHPLLAERPIERVLLVVMTSDRGSCGAFNANVLRRADRFLYENRSRFADIKLMTIGRRARDHFARRPELGARDVPNLLGQLSFRRASEVARGLIASYAGGEVDSVLVLYNEFKSAIVQKVTLRDIWPIAASQTAAAAAAEDCALAPVYEPDARAVLDRLIPRYVATQLWRALLESTAGEHGARMTAMDAASRNARDLIDSYTLQYNRARQATITRELMDIVGGAEALSG